MTYQPATISDDPNTLPKLPGWVTSGRVETLETVAFRSGSVLAVLDQLIGDPKHGVPVKLFANRIALSAATATSKLEGRLAREADIRDAFHLTPLGEARGPDGDLLAFWRDAMRIRAGGTGEIADLIGPDIAGEINGWLKAAQARARTHGPLAGCVTVLRVVLGADDRAERVACLLSDIVLARALNWKVVLPVSAQQLTKTALCDLTATGQRAELAVQARILESIEGAIRLARSGPSCGSASRRGAETAGKRIKRGRRSVPDRRCGRPGVDAVAAHPGDVDSHDGPRGAAVLRPAGRIGRGAGTDRAADIPALWDRAMTVASRKRQPAGEGGAVFDRELDDLPQELRWRAWMGRIEAVLFASAAPVGREDLARVVGQGASVEMLIDDIQAELGGRPYELAQVAGGWMFRTKAQFADAIKAAADLGEQSLAFTEMEMGVLCAIAYHQPIDRAGLADIFGKEVSRDLLARLRYKDLIESGPRSPRPGAPHTFVTTETFLATFDLQSLRDLPEMEILDEQSG